MRYFSPHIPFTFTMRNNGTRTSNRSVIFFVAFYMLTSISVVLMNKYLMTDFKQVNGPMFLTWFQLLVTLIIISAVGEAGKHVSSLSFMPPMKLEWATMKQIYPLSFCFAMMIASNNYCLQYVDVSFFQIARALTIPFNILFTLVILKVKTTRRAVQASVIVVIGYLFGCVAGDLHVSFVGIVFGLLASGFVSMNSILVKKTLRVVNNNQWKLMHYNTVLAMIFLLPILLWSGELYSMFPGVFNTGSRSLSVSVSGNEQEQKQETAPNSLMYFWLIMVITGILGFVINLSTILCVKYTSPLTYSISSNAKSAIQTLLGFVLFNEDIVFQTLVGNLLTIGGSLYYSYVRSAEMHANAKDKVKSVSTEEEKLEHASDEVVKGKGMLEADVHVQGSGSVSVNIEMDKVESVSSQRQVKSQYRSRRA